MKTIRYGQYFFLLAYGMGIMNSAFGAPTGFYGGVLLGGATIHSENEVISGTDGSIIAHTKVKPKAFLAGGLVGWGLRSGCLYGGFEFDGFFADISKTLIRDNDFAEERFHLKNRGQLGGGIRFGFVQPLNCVLSIMPFARVGFQVGRYERKYRVKEAEIPGGRFSVKRTTNVFSFVPALGAELFYKKQFALRVEGRYAPRFTHRLHVKTVPGGVVTTFENSRLYMLPSYRAILVGGTYYINAT